MISEHDPTPRTVGPSRAETLGLSTQWGFRQYGNVIKRRAVESQHTGD